MALAAAAINAIAIRAVMHGFLTAAARLKSMDDPLREAVTKVLAPSIRTNFEVGGRPAWTPLADASLEQKGRFGGSSRPLVFTGALEHAAGSVDSWDIRNNTAQLGNPLTGGIGYGIFHQEGTSTVPQRPWAVMQPEDERKIEDILGNWSFNTLLNAIPG